MKRKITVTVLNSDIAAFEQAIKETREKIEGTDTLTIQGYKGFQEGTNYSLACDKHSTIFWLGMHYGQNRKLLKELKQ